MLYGFAFDLYWHHVSFEGLCMTTVGPQAYIMAGIRPLAVCEFFFSELAHMFGFSTSTFDLFSLRNARKSDRTG